MEEFTGFDFGEREENENVSEQEADGLVALLAKMVEKRDVQVLARIVVAALNAMSVALHTHSEETCEDGCQHVVEFGYTLSMVLASGKAQRLLADMELANLSMAAAYALAVMAPDDHPATTPREVMELLSNTFQEIDADEDGWQESRRKTRDALQMDALLSQIQELPEFDGPRA